MKKMSITLIAIALLLTIALSSVYAYRKYSEFLALNLPDTGQTTSYTDTFGEDSDYTINPPIYTDNGDTVTDEVTGLIWQKSEVLAATSKSEAESYCNTLSLGGYDDWRLPESHELFNLVDHSASNPPFNSTYFANTVDAEYWWSATQRADGQANYWAVNAGGGIGPKPESEAQTRSYYVRCVRGELSMTTQAFTDNGDQTVTDNHTMLMWQQVASSLRQAQGATTWESALTHCESLTLANHEDWRLPNIKELRSISNDETLSNPSVNTTYFTLAQSSPYWSSTTLSNNTTQAWFVDFQYGLVSHQEKTTSSGYLLCVRSASTTTNTNVYLPILIGGSETSSASPTPTTASSPVASPTTTSSPVASPTTTSSPVASPTTTSSPVASPTSPTNPTATPTPSASASATPTPTTLSTCDQLAQVFASYSNLVTFSCDETYMHVHSDTGLPDPNPPSDQKMMVGIINWILRVPVPYLYEWKIPTSPQWVHPYEEASPRGPIAMAVNGVPIFHLERRPDISTDPSVYDPAHDTVLHGELDQCGGHAGQGDDYHYHYAPVCLLRDHDLSQPIAYGLDGVRVYFGTGGTDFFGQGHYNDINNLPAGELDPCNGYQLEDGTYVYYTTADAPYTIGCHWAHVDQDLRIEPRPMNGRDQGSKGPYGGQVGESTETLVTDYYIDSDGWRHMEHVGFSGTGTSAVLVRKSAQSGDCWDFDFREDAATSGVMETYCR